MRIYEILLVDDDDEFLKMIASALELKGYLVTAASSGEAAIETLRGNYFDLVITDLHMPQTDGIAVLKKAKELNPDAVVMIITGNCDTILATDALRLGAYDYMLKPFKLDQLWQRVATCLDRLELEPRQGRRPVLASTLFPNSQIREERRRNHHGG
ncbi:MAG: response regulator [Desulfobacterales bacterium]|nr:response regulator [Desulfobacterales bacterium]